LSTQPELVHAVASFVPPYVVRAIASGRPLEPGQVSRSEGAVIFADVAGFTPMAERLARMMREEAQSEARGAEELTRIMNQAFSAMMTPIQERGGVVMRFSGDALTAYFERPRHLAPAEVVISTLACAHAMQQALSPFAEIQVEDQVFSIHVKIGVGYGPVIFLVLGDDQSARDSLLAGRAVADAGVAQDHAKRDQVVLAPSAWSLLPEVALSSGIPVTSGGDSSSAPEYRLIGPPEHDVSLLSPMGDPLVGLVGSARESMLRDLTSYLPRPLYDRLLVAQGDLPGDYRRVTNLFVFFDGLGATGYPRDAERMEQEAAVIAKRAQAYYSWARAIVERYEGRLLHILADDKGTVLHILFGAPDKRADDPVHSLQCALTLQRDPGRPPFIGQQRIGVASGIVFAAAIGSPRRREYTVIGDDINLSARLTAACPSGEVLVDVYTRDRTVRQFEFETLQPMRLKGKSQPVTAHRLLAERPQETGLVARYLASRWRIVGRDAEVAALRQAADQALAGDGRIIAIEGRAGVGKTRLAEEVVRHWVAQGGDGFVGQAAAYRANSPYHVWANFWHSFFGFAEADSAERRWQKVEVAFARDVPDLVPWAGILAPVLGLPFDTASLFASLDAADRRRKLFEVTFKLLATRAQHRPLLILLEDVHWADRPSLELVDYVSEWLGQAPLLLCLCFRPREDMELEVLSSMRCTWRILDELPADQSAELTRAILGDMRLPPTLQGEIYDKTQGNPLYVEEIINSLVSSGALVPQNGSFRLSGDPGVVAMPDTLQDLLMARIDRLEAPSRELVQVASVVDRRFPYAVLRGVYPYAMADLEMQSRLNELVRPHDLTRLERPEPDLVYLFKHALTRDVAYASLPFARRRQLHQRVGEFIRSFYADRLEEYYSTLAYHFRQGGELQHALSYTLLAGMQAQDVYANQEAMRYYQQVEDYLAQLPIQAHWSSALAMYLKRSLLHRLNGDYQLAEADLNRALDLAQEYQDRRAEAEAYCLLADLRYYEMRNEESLAAASRAHNLALTHNCTRELNTSLVQLGIAYQMLGDVDLSMTYLQQAQELAEGRGDRLMVARALNTMAVAWWLYRGELDKALEGFQQVLQIRREAGAKDREAECLANIANVQFRRGDFEAALETGEAALRVGRAAGWQYGISYVQLDQADIYCYLGDYDAGRRLIQEAQDNLVPGDELGQAYVQLWLGRNLYFDLGRDDLAVPALNNSLEFMREYGHYEEMIRALTALGASYLRQEHLAEARTYLAEAYQLSLSQHFPWQRSEICCRLGLLALAENQLDEAVEWAERAQAAVGQGSSADWLGPLCLLLARIAQRREASRRRVTQLYRQSISLAEARCRAVERVQVWRQAGSYLAGRGSDDAQQQAQAALRQAEEWLQARGSLLEDSHQRSPQGGTENQ
jgi:class 3 adenylate cyclase/tetratricopeptide (TPR) repeat protein